MRLRVVLLALVAALAAAYLFAGTFYRMAGKPDADECTSAISERDFSRAAVSCRLAAEQGDTGAQYNLGLMYRSGNGVPRDYAEALAWLGKAAEKDLSAAQENLGMMYEMGWGVPQNYAQAIAWYRKATEKGDPLALKLLMRMYESGLGVPQDLVKAQALYILAIASGLPEVAQDSDALAASMTSDDIAAAQQLALDCKAKSYKRCGF